MLIVGKTRVLMSHLPMFHPPHDYQILLEVSLSAAGSDPLKTYLDDRKTSKSKIYTWLPKPFLLSALLAYPKAQLTMVGAIFRGHFERGGVAITSDQVEATVERVLYARRLNPKAVPPLELRYLMFGGPAELFLAHLIARAPDFDQVLAAKVSSLPTDWPSEWDGAAIAVRIQGSGHLPGAPLKEGDRVQATWLDRPAAEPFEVVTSTEFYLETGDLAS